MNKIQKNLNLQGVITNYSYICSCIKDVFTLELVEKKTITDFNHFNNEFQG